MAGYDIKFDAQSRLLRCRIETCFRDEELPFLLRDLKAATDLAREDGAMRIMWDNRPARAVTPEIASAIRSIIVDQGRSGERVAILMPNSHAKARGRSQMAATVEMFLSEHAANIWLSVGRDLSPPDRRNNSSRANQL